MAVLVGHARRRRWIPPVHATVDWGHPLARSLHDLVLPGKVNLGIGGNPVATGVPVGAATPMGRGVLLTGGASYDVPDAAFRYTQVGLSATRRPATFRMLFVPVSWPGAFTALIDRSTSTNDCDIGVYIGVTGNLSYTHCGANIAVDAGTLPFGLTLGLLWDVVAVYNGNVTVSYYVNGVAAGAATLGSNQQPTTGVMPWTIGGAGSGGGVAADLRMVAAMGWANRALTASEVAWLYSEPFAMVVTRTPRYYADMATPAVGGGFQMRASSSWVPEPVKVRSAGATVDGTVHYRTGGAWVDSI